MANLLVLEMRSAGASLDGKSVELLLLLVEPTEEVPKGDTSDERDDRSGPVVPDQMRITGEWVQCFTDGAS